MNSNKRILFLCGSPRGKKSASRFTAEYMAQFLDFDYEFLDVAQARLSPNPTVAEPKFLDIVEKMKAADAIVWVFGAWIWFMPLDLQYLLDKLFTLPEVGFSGKLSAAVLTSVRVRDEYILDRTRFISEQLGMHYIGDVSAVGNPMIGYDDDEETTEDSCRILAGQLNRALYDDYKSAHQYAPVERRFLSSTWSGDALPYDLQEVAKTGDKTIAILTGLALDDHPATASIIETIRRSTRNNIKVIELASHKVGRCIGCYQCDFKVEGICVVKDEYEDIKARLLRADAIVFVGVSSCSIVDPLLKAFLDRAWGIAHRPSFTRQYGFSVVSGGDSLGPESAKYLHEITSGWGICSIGALHVGSDTQAFAQTLRRTVEDLDRAMDEKWQIAKRFLSRAIAADFRDLAATAGMVLKADYKYRKDNKLFNAPSPGGLNAVMRWVFRSDRISKKLIAANGTRIMQTRERRKTTLLSNGVRLGTGKFIEKASSTGVEQDKVRSSKGL